MHVNTTARHCEIDPEDRAHARERLERLQRYARENVRESTCYVFRKVWQDDNRLFFKAGPESLMRDSLLQFLSNRLGGNHDVWPEQKVNEKHPVDIRVQTR